MVPTLVPRDEAGSVWPYVAPWLAEALDRYGDYSIEDARALVDDGIWRLWFAADDAGLVGAALTEVSEYPRRRVLWVVAAGGRAREGIEALWPLLRRYAASQGCGVVRLLGRRGWMRSGVLPEGARHDADIVSVEV